MTVNNNNTVRALCFTYDNVSMEIEKLSKDFSSQLATIKAKEELSNLNMVECEVTSNDVINLAKTFAFNVSKVAFSRADELVSGTLLLENVQLKIDFNKDEVLSIEA